MRSLAGAIALLLGACTAEPAAVPSGAPAAGSAAADDPPPPSSGAPTATSTDAAAFDAAAEKLAIEAPAPTLHWLDRAVVDEVLYAIATGAWQITRVPVGVSVQTRGAPRLGQRLGVAAGDTITAIDGTAIAELGGRGALERFATGDRVAVTMRTGATERTQHYRVGIPKSADDRLADLVALTLRRGRTSSIDRALVVAIGESAETLSRHPSMLLELFELPTEALAFGIDGESVDPAGLAAAIGGRAAAERFELSADAKQTRYDIVSGEVESAVLAEAFAAAAARRPRATVGAPVPPVIGELDAGAPGAEVPPPLEVEVVGEEHVRVTRASAEAWIAAPTALARAARIVPAFQDGVIAGFKLYAIRSTSVLYALGFRNGDRIESINGHVLGDIEAAMSAYTKLRKADELSVVLTRKGAPMTLRIEIVDRL